MRHSKGKGAVSVEECDPDAPIHPCGAKEFCPEDPEKCIHFRGGLR
ncbi:MAG: hypothetical protein HA494_01910 [Thaumarchaeota archaeon]|jgi:hypothetical protein|nr:hypothetical protein [Nitrososphaerota archaeon]